MSICWSNRHTHQIFPSFHVTSSQALLTYGYLRSARPRSPAMFHHPLSCSAASIRIAEISIATRREGVIVTQEKLEVRVRVRVRCLGWQAGKGHGGV